MYYEAKEALSIFADRQIIKFSEVFKHMTLQLSERDKENVKDFLLGENIVEDADQTYGREESYQLTNYGKQFYNETKDYETLDKILEFLSDCGKSNSDIQNICQKLDLPFSKLYAIRLVKDNMIELKAASKDYQGYAITLPGESWIKIDGGYRNKLTLLIEEKLREDRKQKKSEQIIHKTEAQNIFNNYANTINDQGTITKTETKSSKTSLLQSVYWVVGIVLTLLSIYGIIKAVN